MVNMAVTSQNSTQQETGSNIYRIVFALPLVLIVFLRAGFHDIELK
jgi:hypothetical protein